MTCRERLANEKPECVGEEYLGGCHQCPHDYGYMDQPDFCDIENCRKCWDREIPETEDVAVKADDKGDEERKTEMTTEEKREKLYEFCEGEECCAGCELADTHSCLFDELSDHEVNRLFEKVFCIADETSEQMAVPHILDSGERKQFESGAVRDIQEGKGRCDLLPLDVVGNLVGTQECMIFHHLALFTKENDIRSLYNALYHFDEIRDWGIPTLLLEVAKHFEEGCKKYGENNWQKGIPTHCYIDSAVRHYLKWARGDKDEPHDRAFVWNILCCIWTCIHKPELNDYAKKDGDHDAE